jgi:hypothetical protein
MSKFRRLTELLTKRSKLTTDNIRFVLNPVDPPQLLERESMVRQVFDEEVERDLREVVNISHFYSRLTSSNII